jgi:hypothetical protein
MTLRVSEDVMSGPSLVEFMSSQSVPLGCWLPMVASNLVILTPLALGKRLCCGPGHHKASYSFCKLPIRLIRNNRHVWQQLIPT